MTHSIEVRHSSQTKSTIPPINFAFGSRLRQIRLNRSMCQVDLACSLGITRSHLEDIESGFASVDLCMLTLLSSVMRLDVPDLLRGL